MKETTILVIDDEPKIVRFIQTSLSLAGYRVLPAYTAREAIETFEREHPDLLVLDLGLPDMDGYEVLENIRSYSTVPIIILTARDDEQNKVRGLEMGADDYITKPFGTPELKARIEAVLRRARWSPAPGDITEFRWRDLHIDFRRRRVKMRGQEIHLTPTEYDLLRMITQHAGHVLTHTELLTQVWGEEYRNDLAILRVNISRLRQKLEDDPREPSYIVTVPGIGYTLPSD